MPASTDASEQRRIGEAKAAIIFDATAALVSEIGYDRTTMDGIAARAGVGKATLYRWWSGKHELVVAALSNRARRERADIDTGSLREDLGQLARDLIALTKTEGRLLLGTAAAGLSDSPQVIDAVREHLLPAERARFASIVERARTRGEISADTPDLAYEIAAAMIMGRFLLTGGKLDERFVSVLVDDILMPVLTAS